MKLKPLLLISVLFIVSFANAEVRGIDVNELTSLKKKGITIIDIRKNIEIKVVGIIPNSYILNFYEKNGKINKELWLHKFVNIIKDRSIKFVLISDDGEHAKKGAQLLHDKKGYKNPFYLKGGIKSWLKEDKKVIK